MADGAESSPSRLTPGIIVLVIAAYAVQLGVSSWKWQWALRIHGLYIPYVPLTRIYVDRVLPQQLPADVHRR